MRMQKFRKMGGAGGQGKIQQNPKLGAILYQYILKEGGLLYSFLSFFLLLLGGGGVRGVQFL